VEVARAMAVVQSDSASAYLYAEGGGMKDEQGERKAGG
jgi:hypothetical protein